MYKSHVFFSAVGVLYLVHLILFDLLTVPAIIVDESLVVTDMGSFARWASRPTSWPSTYG